MVLHDGEQMQSDRSSVWRYRRRAEDIRTFAGGVTALEDRITLLQLADEFDLAANQQEILCQASQSVH